MRIAVLGAGMSGLLAAKAVEECGHEPAIYALDVPGVPKGVHYLHDNCGMDIPSFSIEHRFITNESGVLTLSDYAALYAAKCGGNPLDNSVNRLHWTVEAYSWSDALAELLPSMAPRMRFLEIYHTDLGKLLKCNDMVISTLLLPRMFPEAREACEHHVRYASSRVPDGVGDDDNIVVYNLRPEDNWYRFSRVRGKTQLEMLAKEPDAVPVYKVSKDADWQHDDRRVILAGRQGEWNKNRLVHEVYYNVHSTFSASSTLTS